jgi:hypothetical protein
VARVAGVCLACVVNGVEVAIRIATVHTDAVLLDETGSAGDTIGGAFTNALITTPVTIGARRATRGLVLILRQADIGTHAAVHNKKVVHKIAIDAVGGRGAGASETRPAARLADVAPEFVRRVSAAGAHINAAAIVDLLAGIALEHGSLAKLVAMLGTPAVVGQRE